MKMRSFPAQVSLHSSPPRHPRSLICFNAVSERVWVYYANFIVTIYKLCGKKLNFISRFLFCFLGLWRVEEMKRNSLRGDLGLVLKVRLIERRSRSGFKGTTH